MKGTVEPDDPPWEHANRISYPTFRAHDGAFSEG